MLVQGVLDAFYHRQDESTEDKVLLLLRNSYEQLPSEAHRHMLLDAALVLRERPLAHLTALWEGHLLLDYGKHGPGLLARKQHESYASWQQARRAAAAVKAKQLVLHLLRLSLVSFGMEDDTLDDATQGMAATRASRVKPG